LAGFEVTAEEQELAVDIAANLLHCSGAIVDDRFFDRDPAQA
jgi:hypothetical protein